MKRRKETLGLLWDMGPDSGPGKNGNWSMERKFARIVCTTPVDEACQGCAGIQRRDWSNKREGEKGLNEPDCYSRARTLGSEIQRETIPYCKRVHTYSSGMFSSVGLDNDVLA